MIVKFYRCKLNKLRALILGDICPAGHYCPLGSSEPKACLCGMYCDRAGLSYPTANCSAGYYCNRSSTVPNQFECPPGHYCLENTCEPVQCNKGTFANGTRNTKAEDCLNCTAGHFCGETGKAAPTAACSPG